jgi:competence protein ComEA
MKTWQSILLGIFLGFSTAGIIILVISPPRGKPVELILPPTPGTIKVYIIGAVLNPGVYSLPWKSRINEAVAAAGGFTEQADQASLNLAKALVDGEKIEVPLIHNSKLKSPVVVTQILTGIPDKVIQTPIVSSLINLNEATLEQLMELPGIGETKANDIINFRSQNGPFKSIEEIQNVPGIGPTIFEKLKDLIFVENN